MCYLKSKRIRFFLFSYFIISTSFSLIAQSNLKTVFRNPPQEALPRTYWIWPHGNFDYTRIDEDLKAFKDVGLGGFDVFDFGVKDPYHIIPTGPKFLSDEQMDGICYALKRAKELDLKMGMSVSNGWNAGGEWTPVDERAMNLLFWKDTVEGPIQISKIGFPKIPTLLKKPYDNFQLYPEMDANGFPTYYKDISLNIYPLSEDGTIRDINNIINIDPKTIKGNSVAIDLPAGKWVILRSVVTPIGLKLWVSGRNSKGFIMDHFSKKATEYHFNYLINHLQNRLGSLQETALERLYLASFESEAAVDWTPEFSNEFYRINGYKPESYIPALSGNIIVNKETTSRFLHDYHVTISEMFVNNHYRQARKISNDHGLLLASESGGPGAPLHNVPTEDYKALGAVDVMRGEFWNMKDMWRDKRGGDLMSVIKNIAGAAHVYGHKIVEMESFTSQGKHWRENPLDIKKIADYAFCNGMTRVIYHTASHSPKEAGVPGWSYEAGTHVSPNLTWWPYVKTLNQYFARISALLQQGNFVADVAYFKGEDVPNFSIGYKYVKETLGAGYDYDDINTEILLQTSEVVDGKIKLPCGMEYSLLVLPDYEGKMSVEVLRKVEELLQKGAVIIGEKPVTVYGLANYKEKEQELRFLADKIWGKNPVKKQIKKYGNGYIVTGYTEKEILKKNDIYPDFLAFTDNKQAKIDYIHRSTGSDEIYFINNTDSVNVKAVLQFRASGMEPQLWNPYTGDMQVLSVYRDEHGTTTLPLQLDAYQSVFIVFSKENPAKLHVVNVAYQGKNIFPTKFDNIQPVGYTITNESDNRFHFTSDDDGTYQLLLSDGCNRTVKMDKNRFYDINGIWDVRFTHGWGFDPIQKMDSLVDWTKHVNAELRHYSGMASYKMAFTLPADFIEEGKHCELDLGKVGEAARIYLNGNEVGTSLFSPHKISLQNYLRKGENNIVIEVANTWLNQYLYDVQQPENQRRLRTNVDKDDFVRFGNKPLPSGLMGPVQIKCINEVVFE